jgi:hypothetical protein
MRFGAVDDGVLQFTRQAHETSTAMPDSTRRLRDEAATRRE